MSPSLVTPGKLSSAVITRKGFFPSVRTDVSGKVIAPAETAHAYPTLERFVTSVDAQVSAEFVRPGKPPVAALCRTGVGSLVDRRLARSIGVLPRPQNWSKW